MVIVWAGFFAIQVYLQNIEVLQQALLDLVGATADGVVVVALVDYLV